MRRLLLCSLLISMTIHSIGQAEDEQTPVVIHYPGTGYLLKIVKSYFRSDPYQHDLGFFLKQLMNDPMLVTKSTKLKTDTSFFYFQGAYKNYSPYGFLADHTEIRLAEMEFIIDDSLSLKDTLMVYQLLGFSFNGKAGLESVKNEFSKFNRHYSKHFVTQSSEIKKGPEIVGVTENYFMYGIAVSPLSVTWAKLDEFQNVFIITLRVKMK